MKNDAAIINVIQRLYEGDVVPDSWVGTEKQVLLRAYAVCDSKDEYKGKLRYLQGLIKVWDNEGNDMLIKGFEANLAWNRGAVKC